MKNDYFILSSKHFNPIDTLNCGQIFRYNQLNNGDFVVFSLDKKAIIQNLNNNYKIITDDVSYFKNFFDCDFDYSAVKNQLVGNKFLDKAMEFGRGIRILRNNLVEIIFSFIISANNNIARIQKIIESLCKNCGTLINNDYYAFPTLSQLCQKDEQFFMSIGAGYRAKYLYETSHKLLDFDFSVFDNLSTNDCRNILLSFMGIGPKVADCILLFGLHRCDVFPVDTWIEKVYNMHFFEGEKSRKQITNYFLDKFGNLSGYAQQYLFYYSRSGEKF